MGDGNTADTPRQVIPALLDNRSHALIDVGVDDREDSLAHLEVMTVWNVEHVLDQSIHCFPTNPKELGLAVIDQVETVWKKALGGEVERRGHDRLAGLVINQANILWGRLIFVGRHDIVERVEFGIDVLDQQW